MSFLLSLINKPLKLTLVELQNDTTSVGNTKRLWVQPWKYAENFIITINLLILGCAIEAISGGAGINIPGFPVNLYFIIGLGVVMTLVYVKFRDKYVIKWLSGIPAAISVIVLYSVMVLLLGFIPQDMAQPPVFLKISGLAHVKSSWPFFLLQFYFLIILGFVALKRAIPFKVNNIGFLLNHFGLWLTILAAGLGSSDQQRFSMNLYENEKQSNLGIAENNDKYELPFSLKLLDFNIIEYNPKIGIFDIGTGRFIMGKAKTLPFAESNLETNLGDWHLKVLKYLPQAIYKGGALVPTDSIAGYPAALVLAKNTISNDTVRGWISTGSINLHPDYLKLKGKEYLMLNTPEPKKFYSKLVVFKGSAPPDTIQIEVNKPHTVAGWTIYQSAYNSDMRKWSNLSVVDVVSDPWLPVVYTGIFFLLAGALYMFWIGKDKKE